MRLTSIKIRNFRVFRDFSIRFDKNNAKNDLHIILAKNRTGKTNLLNAVSWCIYDTENHLSDKEKALPILNTYAIEEARHHNGGTEDVLVEVTLQDENGKDIIFTRQQKFSITETEIVPLLNKASIIEWDDNRYITITDDLTRRERVTKYLPSNIQNFIFFDGEQLEKFFSQQERENVKIGIEGLSQSTLIDKTIEKIREYVRVELSPKLVKGNDIDVSKQQLEIERLEDTIKNSNKIIDECNKQIDYCDNEIAERDSIIRGCDKVKEEAERKEKLEKEIVIAEKNLQDIMKETLSFIHSAYPQALFLKTTTPYYNYILEQEKKGNLPPQIDINILKSIISTHHCSICNSDLNDVSHIEELAKKFEVASETASILNKAHGALSSYFASVRNGERQMSRLISEQEKIQLQIDDMEEEYTKIENYLRNIADVESIRKAMNERDEFIEVRKESYKKLGIEENNLEENKTKLEEAKKKLQDILKNNKELEAVNKRIEFFNNAIGILEETRKEVLDECRIEIQEETFRTFLNLLDTEGEYSHISIKPNFDFDLIDRLGFSALGSCSAAEKALLALSFTLALQNVSKHDSLLFIDTPLGRVDPDYRKTFTNLLIKVSDFKQVILAFTPSEYDESVQTIIDNRYSSFNQLSKANERGTIIL